MNNVAKNPSSGVGRLAKSMAGVGSDMVAPFRSARELGSSSGQPVFFNLLPKRD
jgi:hypothetical protein